MNLKLRTFAGYALAAGAVAAGLGLYRGLSAWVGSDLPTFITFYPVLAVVALVSGLGPGLFATALAALAADYWIQEPRGVLAVKSLHDGVALGLFCCMGAFISTVMHLYQRARGKAAVYDQEQALREIRREKEFLAELLEHAAQPFAVGYPDGRIGRFNRAYEQLTGYTSAELRAFNWSTALTPPEWREMEKRKLDELNRTSQPARYEKEYLRKDGSRVPIELLVHLARDAEGKPEYYYSFLTDITERKRAEHELFTLNERLKALMEAVPVGISFSEDATCQRITGNPAVLAQFEVSPEDNLSASAPDAAAPGRQVRFFREGRPITAAELPLQRAVAENKVIPPIELEVVMPSGRRWFADASGAPVRDSQGKVIGGIAVTADITERKQAQEALQRSRDRQALLSRTVSALLVAPDPQTVVEGLCHDVRTFLNCDVFFNFLLDRGASRLRFNACGGVAPKLARKVEGLELGESICGCAARDGCRVLAERIPITPDPRTALVKALGVRAYAAHPLLGPNHEVLGTLSFGTRSRDTFAEEDLGLMKEVAEHVAIAMSRKQIEEQLHKLNEELERRVADATAELRVAYRYARSLIEASLDPLVTISETGKVTDVNQATELVTGVERAQLIGSNFSEYFTEPDKANDGYRQVIRDGLVRDYPLTIRHASGRATDVLYNATVFRNEAGAVQGVFAAARDVTERKRVEGELARYRGHLEELVKERAGQLAEANAQLQASNEVLERFNKLMVDRELRMVELKNEINQLSARVGEPPPYALAFAKDPA